MRLRPNRVVYDAPPPYSGRGRPRSHGAKFKLNDSSTWWTPDETSDVNDPEMERLSSLPAKIENLIMIMFCIKNELTFNIWLVCRRMRN